MAAVLTNVGKALIANRLVSGDSQAPLRFIGWGTGTNGAVAADTALQTETAEARTSGTMSRVTTTVTNDTYQVVGVLTAIATRAVTEVGLFTITKAESAAAPVGDYLVVRSDFAVINVTSGDAIQFTIQIKVA